jgi:hypothetical protein
MFGDTIYIALQEELLYIHIETTPLECVPSPTTELCSTQQFSCLPHLQLTAEHQLTKLLAPQEELFHRLGRLFS